MRALGILGRRAGAPARRRGVVIQPYRGYGTRQEIFLIGRVLRQPGLGPVAAGGTIAAGLLNLLRRALQWGLAEVQVKARLGPDEQTVTTDRDGYFRIHMPLSKPPDAGACWHHVHLELVERRVHGCTADQAKASGKVFVPPSDARFVVISDIDDTVVVTGVANKLKMMWRLFFESAESRVAYAGVGAFYRALHAGASLGHGLNPILYVSRGPWSLYDVLEAFFRRHDIPVGPILFLREWGLTLQRPLPPKAKDHKLTLIRRMLDLYETLPFILVGDSGQKDPEIYADIVRAHPERVAAVYIRNVKSSPARVRAIEGLAKEVAEAGSTMMLADDSYAMAKHAFAHGFMSGFGLADVMRGQRQDLPAPTPDDALAQPPPERVAAASPHETREVVERGEVAQALKSRPDGAEPPVVVESGQEGPGRKRAKLGAADPGP